MKGAGTHHTLLSLWCRGVSQASAPFGMANPETWTGPNMFNFLTNTRGVEVVFRAGGVLLTRRYADRFSVVQDTSEYRITTQCACPTVAV